MISDNVGVILLVIIIFRPHTAFVSIDLSYISQLKMAVKHAIEKKFLCLRKFKERIPNK